MILDKKKLIENGYLVFNLKDLNEDLFNKFLEEFNKDYLRRKINYFRNDSTVLTDKITEFNKDLYKFPVKPDEKNPMFFERDYLEDFFGNKVHCTDIKAKFQGKLENLKKLQNYLDDMIKTSSVEQNGQQWYYGNFRNDTPGQKLELISSLYLETVKSIYKDDIVSENSFDGRTKYNQDNNITLGTDITLYLKNNYIYPHEDGVDGNRLCVLLMYLNEDWKDGYGGEIIIDEKVTLPPLFGNIAILDFTENNTSHEVKKIINENFERFAIIKFFYK